MSTRRVNVLQQIMFTIYTYRFQKIVTVTFGNVCRLVYETSSSINNALQYNVYHRCLCYILSTKNVDVEPWAKQRARDYTLKSFMDHGLHTWTEQFPSNHEKVNAKRVSYSLPGEANELEKQIFFRKLSSCKSSSAK